MRAIVSSVLMGFFLFNPNGVALEEHARPTHAETASAIRVYYESRLAELNPVFRGHWNLRLYRTSGEERYVSALKEYGLFLSESFTQFVSGLEDPVLRARKIDDLLGPVQKSNKGKYGKRRQILSAATEYLYMHQLLYLAFMTKSMGLDHAHDLVFRKALTALRGFSFEPYLKDRNLLLYFTAEISNDVYYLKKLGLGNFEAEFFRFFQNTYSSVDTSVDPVLFENKVYGLTHLVIADSEYYQRKVSRKKFRWILKYFEKNIDEILSRLKPDVAAEVGLCFILAGLPDHSVVVKTREFIAGAWDPASGIIPSVQGNTDLNNGEHRNVLAYMLLKGFTQLYSGPDLSVN